MPLGIADAQLSATSGARQVALMEAGMIAPGAIITGAAWVFVRVVREACEGGWVLDVYPRVAAPHTCAFAARGEGRECSICHAFIVTAAQLLPLTEGGVPRAFVLVPDGLVEAADPWTVYVTAAGASLTCAPNETGGLIWPASHVPIIPRLGIGWRLTSALRALLEEW